MGLCSGCKHGQIVRQISEEQDCGEGAQAAGIGLVQTPAFEAAEEAFDEGAFPVERLLGVTAAVEGDQLDATEFKVDPFDASPTREAGLGTVGPGITAQGTAIVLHVVVIAATDGAWSHDVAQHIAGMSLG